MSRENIEFMRGVFADWNRRDWEAWKAKHHADMVAIPDRDWPEFEPLQGCDAWLHQVQVMLEAWDEQRLEIDDIHAEGDVVVMSFRWVARGRKTQIDVEIPTVGKYTVTDGKIKRMEFFADPAAAAKGLRASGEGPLRARPERRRGDQSARPVP